jgi:hypothetical protein
VKGRKRRVQRRAKTAKRAGSTKARKRRRRIRMMKRRRMRREAGFCSFNFKFVVPGSLDVVFMFGIVRAYHANRVVEARTEVFLSLQTTAKTLESSEFPSGKLT